MVYVCKKDFLEPYSEIFYVIQRYININLCFLLILHYIKVLQDVKCGVSTFRIRLTYTHAEASKMIQNSVKTVEGCKRRKVGKSCILMLRLITLKLGHKYLHLHFTSPINIYIFID